MEVKSYHIDQKKGEVRKSKLKKIRVRRREKYIDSRCQDQSEATTPLTIYIYIYIYIY